jgi:hypothetical protein
MNKKRQLVFDLSGCTIEGERDVFTATAANGLYVLDL